MRRKHLRMNHAGQVRKPRNGEQARVRIIILALVFFLMGVAVSALWFSRRPSAKTASQTDEPQALAHSASVSPQPQPEPQTALAELDAIKRFIPNVNSTSLEEGTRILREDALAEFKQTAQDLRVRQKEAEQKFIQGQNNHSDELQQVATKQLRELQAEQVEKLKQIAAKSKAQIEAFQQLKGAVR